MVWSPTPPAPREVRSWVSVSLGDRRQLFLSYSSLIICPDGPVSILVIDLGGAGRRCWHRAHTHCLPLAPSRGAASVPPLTYQMWCWLELVAPLRASWWAAQKTCSFLGAGLSPREVRTGTRVRSQRTAVFCADCTSEAGCSQSDYYGAAHGLWLILVRTDGALSSSALRSSSWEFLISFFDILLCCFRR